MKKSFKQSWGSNMSKAGEPKIKEFSGEEFTKITFYPDLSKFNMEKLDEDTIALLSRWDLLDMHFISLPFFPNLSLLHGLIHFIKYIFISLYLGEPTTLLRHGLIHFLKHNFSSLYLGEPTTLLRRGLIHLIKYIFISLNLGEPTTLLRHGLIHLIKYIFISLYLGEPTTLLRPRGESRSSSTASGCPSRTSRIMWISTSR